MSPSICSETIEDEILKTINEAKANRQSEISQNVLIFMNIYVYYFIYRYMHISYSLDYSTSQISQWAKVHLGETSLIDATYNPLALDVFGKLDPNIYSYTKYYLSISLLSDYITNKLYSKNKTNPCKNYHKSQISKENREFLKPGNNMKFMVEVVQLKKPDRLVLCCMAMRPIITRCTFIMTEFTC